jgi:hypothetical protein
MTKGYRGDPGKGRRFEGAGLGIHAAAKTQTIALSENRICRYLIDIVILIVILTFLKGKRENFVPAYCHRLMTNFFG